MGEEDPTGPRLSPARGPQGEVAPRSRADHQADRDDLRAELRQSKEVPRGAAASHGERTVVR